MTQTASSRSRGLRELCGGFKYRMSEASACESLGLLIQIFTGALGSGAPGSSPSASMIARYASCCSGVHWSWGISAKRPTVGCAGDTAVFGVCCGSCCCGVVVCFMGVSFLSWVTRVCCSLARDRVDHHGGQQARLGAAIAPAVVDALDDHRVGRFEQDLLLVEDEVDLAAQDGGDVEGVGRVDRGVALLVFVADLVGGLG